jgi:hypothetical protein
MSVFVYPAIKSSMDGLLNVITAGVVLVTVERVAVISTRYVEYTGPCVKSPDNTPEGVNVRIGEGNSAGYWTNV